MAFEKTPFYANRQEPVSVVVRNFFSVKADEKLKIFILFVQAVDNCNEEQIRVI
jgi:hypothetical protein